MASSLHGRFAHLAATRPARNGRAYLAAISNLAGNEGPTWTVELHREVKYARLAHASPERLEALRLLKKTEHRKDVPKQWRLRCVVD